MNYLELINKLLLIIGNATLEEAKSWLEVEANAQSLVDELVQDAQRENEN